MQTEGSTFNKPVFTTLLNILCVCDIEWFADSPKIQANGLSGRFLQQNISKGTYRRKVITYLSF